MSLYKVTITESLERVVLVEAHDAWEAKQHVVDDYYTGKLTLNHSDFDGVEIYVEEKENKLR